VIGAAPQMSDLTVGARIRLARELAGVSMAEAARRCGRSRESWNDYEHDRLPMRASVLRAFAEIFDVSVDWILFGEAS
jgi:transcriptional regulator with XRE-family HTH domain